MLQPVFGLPVTLVEPWTASANAASWTLGARLLAKAPWSRLWAPAEITALDASTATVVFPHGGRTAQLAHTQLAASPYQEGEAGDWSGSALNFGQSNSGLMDAADSDEEDELGSVDGSLASDASGQSDVDSEQEEEDDLDSSSGVPRLALGLRPAGAMEHARSVAWHLPLQHTLSSISNSCSSSARPCKVALVLKRVDSCA